MTFLSIIKTILIILFLIVGFWGCYSACVIASQADRYAEHYDAERKEKYGKKL